MLFVRGKEFAELESWAEISLTVHNSAFLLQSVARSKLDAAFIARDESPQHNIVMSELGVEPLVLVAHCSLVPELFRHLKNGVLPNFLAYNKLSTTYHLINITAARAGIQLQPILYSTSPEIIYQLTLQRKGAAILPYFMIAPKLVAGSLSSLPLGRQSIIPRRIFLAQSASRTLPVLLDKTVTHTQHMLSDLMRQASSDLDSVRR